jgi:hypothetical protein
VYPLLAQAFGELLNVKAEWARSVPLNRSRVLENSFYENLPPECLTMCSWNYAAWRASERSNSVAGRGRKPAKPKADKKAKGSAKAAKGAPAKGKTSRARSSRRVLLPGRGADQRALRHE